MWYSNFNPRSDERSDRYSTSSGDDTSDFNPRSDERSDYRLPDVGKDIDISIHAPTNGATMYWVHWSTSSVFQSTLRRTERPIGLLQDFAERLFQSTLRRTERLHCIQTAQSIGYFNPRSDERSDCAVFGKLIKAANFNPRSDERSDKIIFILIR